jgi:hypothetical protein
MARSVASRFTAAALTGLVASAIAVVAGSPGAEAFPDTANPVISLDHTVRTEPFVGSNVSMQDHEGSAYVPRDNSLWLADDNGRKIYEINPATGALKRVIADKDFIATPQFGGGPVAGYWRDRDLESISYDAVNDTLYVFSGKCCKPEIQPTVYKLKRDASGAFQLLNSQPLPAGSDFTGSAWNPGDGQLYVGDEGLIQTYDYPTNTAGPTFHVSGVSRITGMTFSAGGTDLWVTHATTKVSRIKWSTRTLVSGWSFDLSPFGVMDARAVEIINDQLWISDGYDYRKGTALSHALFVFNVNKPASPSNLVKNPGFETDTSGWNNNGTAGVTLERVAGGHSGSFAGRLTNTNTTSKTITLNDASPNSEPSTGTSVYTATAWVRSDNTTATATLRLREYNGSTQVQAVTAPVTLSTSWQMVTLTLTPQAAGSSYLDLNVLVTGAPAGANLYIDDVSLFRG